MTMTTSQKTTTTSDVLALLHANPTPSLIDAAVIEHIVRLEERVNSLQRQLLDTELRSAHE